MDKLKLTLREGRKRRPAWLGCLGKSLKLYRPALVWGLALASLILISVLNPDPAHAQNLESFASKVRGLLSSTLLRTLAVIAVIVTGLLWFTGRASTAILVTVIIGIAIVFSADSIVGLIAG